MIIPFLKHITKIQNQRGKVKYFVVYFQKKGDKYQVLLNSTCKCNRILINNLLIIRTQKVAFIS